jgi:hypothetical protein
LDRLFAIISHGFAINEKQAQMACIIISNIAQVGARAFAKFRPYEKILALVSFNDESLSPITSMLLFSLSGRGGEGEAVENAAVENLRMNIRNEMESESSMENESDDE